MIGERRPANDDVLTRLASQEGAVGYILAWFLGVPASVLFLIFLLRGCN